MVDFVCRMVDMLAVTQFGIHAIFFEIFLIQRWINNIKCSPWFHHVQCLVALLMLALIVSSLITNKLAVLYNINNEWWNILK